MVNTERGKIWDPATSTTWDMGKITAEDVSFKTGLIKKSIPLTTPNGTIFESVWGKTRILTVSGFKYGTQAQIETFIKQFTDWGDQNGFIDPLYYYPLFHPANTLAGSGLMNAYYKCIVNDFSYRASLTEAGFVIRYDVELFQGTTVI